MKRNPRITSAYEIWDEEAIEAGDTDDRGWHDEDGYEIDLDEYDVEEGLMLADKTVEYLRDEGATEPSSTGWHSGVWYSWADDDINFRTGEREMRSYFLKDFTPAEEREVFEQIVGGRASFGATNGGLPVYAEKIEFANKDEAMFYADNSHIRNSGLWLLQFGAYGTTYVAVWGDGDLSAAFEVAAEWLAENAPGHLTSEEEMMELYKEAAEDHGIAWPIEDWDDPRVEAMREDAEADMSYTESGWLTSYETQAGEIDKSEPLYFYLFEASIEGEEFDDDEWEDIEKVEKDLKRAQNRR